MKKQINDVRAKTRFNSRLSAKKKKPNKHYFFLQGKLQQVEPKKSFGQHFLRDMKVLEAIVRAIHPQSSDTIIEIGPGKGVLTLPLLQTGAAVTAVELDRDMIAVLQARFKNPGNLNLVYDDILTFQPTFAHFKLVGNIPYNLTTKLVEKILAWPVHPTEIVFLLQKEVGEKMATKGGKNSPLAVATAMLGIPKLLLHVPPTAFNPPPKVQSVVIHIDGAYPFETNDRIAFYDFVHKVFRQPRKTLFNNLLALLSREQATELVDHLQVDPMIRPERLDTQKLYDLFLAYQKIKNQND